MKLNFAIGALDAEAEDIHLSLRSKSGSAMQMVKARAERDKLSPGATWNAELSIKVRKSDKPLEMTVNLGVRKHSVWYSERLIIPVTQAAAAATRCEGPHVTASADVELLRNGLDQSFGLGNLKAGESLPCVDRVGAYYRVRLPRHGIAYVAAQQMKKGQGTSPQIAFVRTPPSIILEKGLKTEVEGKQLMLDARAKDEMPLHNVVVYRGRKKVLFESGGRSDVAIKSSIDLDPGQNLITVHAREDVKYGSSISFWVLRREGWEPK